MVVVDRTRLIAGSGFLTFLLTVSNQIVTPLIVAASAVPGRFAQIGAKIGRVLEVSRF